MYTTRFNKQCCNLLTHSICVFLVLLMKNSHYFSCVAFIDLFYFKERLLCSLRGTNWIFITRRLINSSNGWTTNEVLFCKILIIKKDFSLQIFHTDPRANTDPYSKCAGVLSPGVKRPGREVNYLGLPPSITEVKNEWSYSSTPWHVFMAWTGRTVHFYLYSYNKNSALESFNTLVYSVFIVVIRMPVGCKWIF
jgi:hypothetical protein